MKRVAWFLLVAAAVMALALPTAAQTPNLATVAARVSEAPVIDGVLDDAAWLTASQMGAKLVCDQDNTGAFISAYPRVAYLAYDDNNLYVGIKIFTADASALVTEAASYWNTDEVEVFLECPDTMMYYKITVTSAGDCYEASGIGLSTAAVSKGDTYWVIEAVMPFVTLGKTPKAGDVWGINVVGHQVADGDMWICWNPTYGGFNNPSRFGSLTFLD